MNYRVQTFKDAGLEARWSKTSAGKPYIVARDPNASTEHQRTKWWVVDNAMFETMKKVGVREGFDQHTLLGNVFSIAA